MMKIINYSLAFLCFLVTISSCNQEDESCETTTLWYADTDGDGFGNSESFIEICSTQEAPEGYVTNNDDINDNDDEILDEIILGNWVEKSSFNGNSRYDVTTFVIDGKGYLFGGYDGDDFYNDTWVYDPVNNYWNQLDNNETFTGIKRRRAVGFAINGKGYIGTGFGYDELKDDNIELKDFYEYDPATDTWTAIADFPGTARYGAIGFSIGNFGYVGTGYDGSEQKDFYKYDPTTNTWEEVIGFSGDKRQSASVFVINDIAYIGTGIENGKFTNDFYSFDGINWTELSDMQDKDGNPIYLYSGASFATGGKGYYATGVFNSITNLVWEYTPSSDTWDELTAKFEGPSRQGAAAFSFEEIDKSFIFTGRSGSASFDDMWEFEPYEKPNKYD